MRQKDTLIGLLQCLDLTNLNDDCDADAIAKLCANGQTKYGNVAAVCIWARFIPQAKKLLSGTGIKIATVVNFPDGGDDTKAVEAEIAQALTDGADEIDYVLNYTTFLQGDRSKCIEQLKAVRVACGAATLKVILETGELKTPHLIEAASIMALDAGADFLKTSTGKVPVNARLSSTQLLLAAIARKAPDKGFKAAGGIKSADDALAFFKVAQEIRGDSVPNPDNFRFGASSLLDALVATIEGKATKVGAGY